MSSPPASRRPGQQPPGYPYPSPAPAYPPPPSSPPSGPGGQRLAEFTDRLGAYVIDGAILGAIISVVVVPICLVALLATLRELPDQVIVDQERVTPELSTGEMFDILLPLLGTMAALLVFALALAYVYHVELMFRSGQTLGKRIMRIRVLPLDPAATLTRGAAARRFVAAYGLSLVPGLGWIDGLWQLWDKPYRQCLHDKWPRTAVIKLYP